MDVLFIHKSCPGKPFTFFMFSTYCWKAMIMLLYNLLSSGWRGTGWVRKRLRAAWHNAFQSIWIKRDAAFAVSLSRHASFTHTLSKSSLCNFYFWVKHLCGKLARLLEECGLGECRYATGILGNHFPSQMFSLHITSSQLFSLVV